MRAKYLSARRWPTNGISCKPDRPSATRWIAYPRASTRYCSSSPTANPINGLPRAGHQRPHRGSPSPQHHGQIGVKNVAQLIKFAVDHKPDLTARPSSARLSHRPPQVCYHSSAFICHCHFSFVICHFSWIFLDGLVDASPSTMKRTVTPCCVSPRAATPTSSPSSATCPRLRPANRCGCKASGSPARSMANSSKPKSANRFCPPH